MSERLTEDLLALLGEDRFVALVEAFGGTRLYVPNRFDTDHAIVEAIGEKHTQLLTERYAPDLLRIPLARDIRARHYLARKLSNAEIARKLGITETAVEKMIKRLQLPPRRLQKALPLFDT